jgi:methylmalonyl-CoA mutase
MGERYVPQHKIRIVTATSLFDGHDASINIMRRVLQAAGAEVIHLGHNRSAEDVVTAAIQEDVQAVAVSSYQGGHLEYFRYIRELLDARGGRHVKLFGGGGGVIVPDEIRALGRRLGLQGIIDDLLSRCDVDTTAVDSPTVAAVQRGDAVAVARMITLAERDLTAPGSLGAELRAALEGAAEPVPVVGITGTGGAGKSSLTVEGWRR